MVESPRFRLGAHAFDFFAGSAEDRVALLRLHDDYLKANANQLDGDALRRLWSADPRRVFFYGGGVTYRGRDGVLDLWKRERGKFAVTEPWTSSDVRLTGNADMAVITAERSAKLRWTGEGPAPFWTDTVWRSRSTEVFVHEAGAWCCAHIHVSDMASSG